MPGFIGKRLCPQLVMIPPRMDKYKAVSVVISNIISKYDPDYEMGSLDEAYLDITKYCADHSLTPGDVLFRLRTEIKQTTGLTASGGAGANKMLAKVRGDDGECGDVQICSDVKKPNNQFILKNDSDAIRSFMSQLSVRKVPFIGKVTETFLHGIGIATCADIWEQRYYLYQVRDEDILRHDQ